MAYFHRREREPDKAALRWGDASLTLPLGKTTAVAGASGSGKTTLLNLMGLLLDPQSGGIVLNDGESRWDYRKIDDRQRDQLRRIQFGFILQNSFMLPHFTCLENIAMPLALTGIPCRDRLKRARELVQLADAFAEDGGRMIKAAERPAGEVSGGEKQRMAILRALIHRPSLVFADEPISNLDPENQLIMIRLLKRWKAGKVPFARRDDETGPRTLILVSHSLKWAHRLGEGFLVLRQGRVVEDRLIPKAEVPTPRDLRRLISATGMEVKS